MIEARQEKRIEVRDRKSIREGKRQDETKVKKIKLHSRRAEKSLHAHY
jgi:hypothetical protein